MIDRRSYEEFGYSKPPKAGEILLAPLAMSVAFLKGVGMPESDKGKKVRTETTNTGTLALRKVVAMLIQAPISNSSQRL